MIHLYKATETAFSTNGIILNEWVELKVTEILNGEYSIKGVYPVSNTMKYLELLKGSIIYAPTPTGQQPFRIMSVEKDIDEVIVEGFHIFYDLAANIVPSGLSIRGNGDTAIKKTLSSCENKHPFTGYSDIKGTHNFNTTEDLNPLLILFNGKHCLSYMWGAELYRDNFKVGFLDRLGTDTNIIIAYGKNLLNFKNNSSWDSVVTKIKVTYTKTIMTDSENAEGVTTTIKADVVSDIADQYPIIYTKTISIEDMDNSLEINNKQDLINYVKKYYFEENNIDKPKFSVSIDWIKEHDYEGLRLGDTAIIHHEQYDFFYRLRITKYVYDCLLEDYDELFFGDLEGQIENVVTTQGSTLDGISSAISNHTTNIYELNKRLTDLENPIYYPNLVYNSNFSRFDESGKPDFWETTGSISNLEALVGQYSLRLQAGEYLKMKGKPITAFKWLDLSTDFTFRVIGTGKIKVKILADNIPQDIFSYVDNEYQTSKEFIMNITSTNWFDSKRSVELHPSTKTVVLYIECIEGTVYIDGVQVAPITQGSKLDIQYIDGPLCYNDSMQFRKTDLINAKVGDMWFRGDL